MTLERRAWIVARIMAVMLVLVSLRAAYWQIVKGESLNPVAINLKESAIEYARLQGDSSVETGQVVDLSALPQAVVQRTVQMLSTIERGKIYDRKGNILAEDQGQPGNSFRYYYDPSMAHFIGYTSAVRIGVSGLEATYNDYLLSFDRLDAEIARTLHRPTRGDGLYLTIDPEIQLAAVEGLANLTGAIVVLDGKTGAVLAMTSTPSFDPNRLLEEGYITSLGSAALLNRATQGLYTPGSTWKTVTMIAALDSGQVKPDSIFDFGEPRISEDGKNYYVYEVDGGIIPDYTHQQRQLDLASAYAYSANVAFAKLADEMNPEIMIDFASRLGFSSNDYAIRFPFEIPVIPSQLANDVNSIRNNALLRASTGFGQGEILATPINMAMVVEAVLNGGSISVPYFVESIRDPDGKILSERPNHHTVTGLMKAETARQVKEIMAVWIQKFAGGEKFIGYNDVEMGMKTGTAQLGGDQLPHAWVIGYVEKGPKSAVVVVLFENLGGSNLAIPIFKKLSQKVISTYLLIEPQP